MASYGDKSSAIGVGENSTVTDGAKGLPEKVSSPIYQGEPVTIRTIYKKNWDGTGRYDAEAYDAKFNSETGELSLDYASDKEFDNSHPSNKHKSVDITVASGMIDGSPVNLNLNNPSIKTINANSPKYLSAEAQKTIRAAGFEYDSHYSEKGGRWVKGYKGYSSSGSHLRVDSAIPDDLSSFTRISGETYAVRDRIKRAGFKFDGQSKEWVKK